MDALGAFLDRLNTTCVIVTSSDGSRPVGCLVTFIAPASIDPRRVAVMTSQENLTHEVIGRTGVVAVNLVPSDGREWLAHWGYQSGRQVDKFEGIPWHPGENGCPLLDEAIGWIEGRVVASLRAGDHTVRLVEPTAAFMQSPQSPLFMVDALARGWEEPNTHPPPRPV